MPDAIRYKVARESPVYAGLFLVRSLPARCRQVYSHITDFADKDFLDGYDLKKPSGAALRAAIDAVRKESASITDLEIDPDPIAQRLIELNSELDKRG